MMGQLRYGENKDEIEEKLDKADAVMVRGIAIAQQAAAMSGCVV